MLETTTSAMPASGQTVTETGTSTIPQDALAAPAAALSGETERSTRLGSSERLADPIVSVPERTVMVPPGAVTFRPRPSSTLAPAITAIFGILKCSVRLGARHERPGRLEPLPRRTSVRVTAVACAAGTTWTFTTLLSRTWPCEVAAKITSTSPNQFALAEVTVTSDPSTFTATPAWDAALEARAAE